MGSGNRRGVAGEEHAAYPCPALPFSGCLIDYEHENDLSMIKSRYDVVILGAGHNGLVAASYLGRAGLSVLLLEKNNYIGGASPLQKLLPHYQAQLSRCSYLVSLFPEKIIRELGLTLELRRRA